MPELSNISTIKSILTRYDYRMSKSMGQNFLTDPSVCPKMADYARGVSSNILEIGPGLGVLSVELAKRADKVVSIELDEKLKPILAETLAGYDNIAVIFGDALKINLEQIIAGNFDNKPVVCANLPYYITSPIIMRLLKMPVSAIIVMVQKEAARRICAPLGTRECGAVTAAVAYHSTPTKLFDVPRGCFYPVPNVDSSVIKLELLDSPPVDVDDEKLFFRVIKSAFAQRRKTIHNSISAGLGLPKDVIAAALDYCAIPQNERAERLTLEDFARIANRIGTES